LPAIAPTGAMANSPINVAFLTALQDLLKRRVSSGRVLM